MMHSADNLHQACDQVGAVPGKLPLGLSCPLLPPLPPLGCNWMLAPLQILASQFQSGAITDLEFFADIFQFWDFGITHQNTEINGLYWQLMSIDSVEEMSQNQDKSLENQLSTPVEPTPQPVSRSKRGAGWIEQASNLVEGTLSTTPVESMGVNSSTEPTEATVLQDIAPEVTHSSSIEPPETSHFTTDQEGEVDSAPVEDTAVRPPHPTTVETDSPASTSLSEPAAEQSPSLKSKHSSSLLRSESSIERSENTYLQDVSSESDGSERSEQHLEETYPQSESWPASEHEEFSHQIPQENITQHPSASETVQAEEKLENTLNRETLDQLAERKGESTTETIDDGSSAVPDVVQPPAQTVSETLETQLWSETDSKLSEVPAVDTSSAEDVTSPALTFSDEALSEIAEYAEYRDVDTVETPDDVSSAGAVPDVIQSQEQTTSEVLEVQQSWPETGSNSLEASAVDLSGTDSVTSAALTPAGDTLDRVSPAVPDVVQSPEQAASEALEAQAWVEINAREEDAIEERQSQPQSFEEATGSSLPLDQEIPLIQWNPESVSEALVSETPLSPNHQAFVELPHHQPEEQKSTSDAPSAPPSGRPAPTQPGVEGGGLLGAINRGLGWLLSKVEGSGERQAAPSDSETSALRSEGSFGSDEGRIHPNTDVEPDLTEDIAHSNANSTGADDAPPLSEEQHLDAGEVSSDVFPSAEFNRANRIPSVSAAEPFIETPVFSPVEERSQILLPSESTTGHAQHDSSVQSNQTKSEQSELDAVTEPVSQDLSLADNTEPRVLGSSDDSQEHEPLGVASPSDELQSSLTQADTAAIEEAQAQGRSRPEPISDSEAVLQPQEQELLAPNRSLSVSEANLSQPPKKTPSVPEQSNVERSIIDFPSDITLSQDIQDISEPSTEDNDVSDVVEPLLSKPVDQTAIPNSPEVGESEVPQLIGIEPDTAPHSIESPDLDSGIISPIAPLEQKYAASETSPSQPSTEPPQKPTQSKPTQSTEATSAIEFANTLETELLETDAVIPSAPDSSRKPSTDAGAGDRLSETPERKTSDFQEAHLFDESRMEAENNAFSEGTVIQDTLRLEGSNSIEHQNQVDNPPSSNEQSTSEQFIGATGETVTSPVEAQPSEHSFVETESLPETPLQSPDQPPLSSSSEHLSPTPADGADASAVQERFEAPTILQSQSREEEFYAELDTNQPSSPTVDETESTETQPSGETSGDFSAQSEEAQSIEREQSSRHSFRESEASAQSGPTHLTEEEDVVVPTHPEDSSSSIDSVEQSSASLGNASEALTSSIDTTDTDKELPVTTSTDDARSVPFSTTLPEPSSFIAQSEQQPSEYPVASSPNNNDVQSSSEADKGIQPDDSEKVVSSPPEEELQSPGENESVDAVSPTIEQDSLSQPTILEQGEFSPPFTQAAESTTTEEAVEASPVYPPEEPQQPNTNTMGGRDAIESTVAESPVIPHSVQPAAEHPDEISSNRSDAAETTLSSDKEIALPGESETDVSITNAPPIFPDHESASIRHEPSAAVETTADWPEPTESDFIPTSAPSSPDASRSDLQPDLSLASSGSVESPPDQSSVHWDEATPAISNSTGVEEGASTQVTRPSDQLQSPEVQKSESLPAEADSVQRVPSRDDTVLDEVYPSSLASDLASGSSVQQQPDVTTAKTEANTGDNSAELNKSTTSPQVVSEQGQFAKGEPQPESSSEKADTAGIAPQIQQEAVGQNTTEVVSRTIEIAPQQPELEGTVAEDFQSIQSEQATTDQEEESSVIASTSDTSVAAAQTEQPNEPPHVVDHDSQRLEQPSDRTDSLVDGEPIDTTAALTPEVPPVLTDIRAEDSAQTGWEQTGIAQTLSDTSDSIQPEAEVDLQPNNSRIQPLSTPLPDSSFEVQFEVQPESQSNDLTSPALSQTQVQNENEPESQVSFSGADPTGDALPEARPIEPTQQLQPVALAPDQDLAQLAEQRLQNNESEEVANVQGDGITPELARSALEQESTASSTKASEADLGSLESPVSLEEEAIQPQQQVSLSSDQTTTTSLSSDVPSSPSAKTSSSETNEVSDTLTDEFQASTSASESVAQEQAPPSVTSVTGVTSLPSPEELLIAKDASDSAQQSASPSQDVREVETEGNPRTNWVLTSSPLIQNTALLAHLALTEFLQQDTVSPTLDSTGTSSSETGGMRSEHSDPSIMDSSTTSFQSDADSAGVPSSWDSLESLISPGNWQEDRRPDQDSDATELPNIRPLNAIPNHWSNVEALLSPSFNTQSAEVTYTHKWSDLSDLIHSLKRTNSNDTDTSQAEQGEAEQTQSYSAVNWIDNDQQMWSSYDNSIQSIIEDLRYRDEQEFFITDHVKTIIFDSEASINSRLKSMTFLRRPRLAETVNEKLQSGYYDSDDTFIISELIESSSILSRRELKDF